MPTLNTVRTIRRELQRKAARLSPDDQRAQDQAYGAIEALRWILGEGPNPVGLADPLQSRRDKTDDDR